MDNTYTNINIDGASTGIFQFLATYLIILLVIVIVIYIAIGIFLNKLNKLKYGKGTPMAFIPFANTYLLGKLTISKPVGLILVFLQILTGTSVNTDLNGEGNMQTLLPADISSKINSVVSLVTLGLLIYAIFLYFKLKKEKKNETYIKEQEKRPLEDKNKDIINNIINATKETNTINSYNENINNNSNTNSNTNTTNNVSNYNVGNTSINRVETSTNATITTNTNPNNNVYSNNEQSELMKHYQNNDPNN